MTFHIQEAHGPQHDKIHQKRNPNCAKIENVNFESLQICETFNIELLNYMKNVSYVTLTCFQKLKNLY
jgi:hypothetical protein